MFNIGAGEMVFILIAALLVLGPQRLPELARGIGKFLREFRRQTDEVRNVVVREFYAMDQEVQRPPPRIAPPNVANAAPVVPPTEPAALPAPAASPAPEAAAHPGLPSPLASTLSEAAQAGDPVVASTASAAPADPEQEEPLPRFDSIPGTVARNAPKQS